MAKIILTPHSISKVTLCLVLVSVVAAILYIPLQRVEGLRGILGAIGLMCSLLSSGIAAWFSIRMRDRRCMLVALVSLLPLAFWAWLLYERVYGQYAA